MRRVKPAPTIEEHEALAAFAHLYGRTWKHELRRRWENGTLLLSQVNVSEDALACLVRLKGKLGPSGLRTYKAPTYVVETRVDGLPWGPAFLPNERAPEHDTPAEALARVAYLLTLDDPTWRRAEYRIVMTRGFPTTPGPMRCACSRPVMLARRGNAMMTLEPAPENTSDAVFTFFQGAAIPDPHPGHLADGMMLYREHACSRPGEGGRA